MGVVYHTHYLDYFEAARTEALRELGVVYRELEESGVIMPVINASINYHRPAYYDDQLQIVTTFEQLPQVRVPIDYEVYREGTERALVTGQVTLCFVDATTRRPTSPPEHVSRVFEKAFA